MQSSQLIPPADQAPPSIAHLSPADRVRLWAQMVDEGDTLIFDGFPRGHDAASAHLAAQEWVARRAADSVEAKVRMLTRRRLVEPSHGG